MPIASPTRSPTTAPAFHAERYQLPIRSVGQLAAALSPVRPDEAAGLASRMCAIPPWSTYQVNPAHLESLFRVSAGGAVALAVRLPNAHDPVGVAVIRSPWLIGPYMQFLGLDPGVHGQGLGTRILSWMEAEARLANARNLWICAAGFNEGAQRLYERFGFETVAALDDLIKDGVPEILMRKRLT
jgi:ribosomal protein S18 acetylase RimI-like enzyme